MSLFKIYWDLPFDTCLVNFAKIYNDVFSFEKPQNVQKYYITEVQLVEFDSTKSRTAAQHGNYPIVV
jgi:hypothetical protein